LLNEGMGTQAESRPQTKVEITLAPVLGSCVLCRRKNGNHK
jgi:hypothetical protein